MKKKSANILILAAVVLISAVPLLLIHGKEGEVFQGSDDQGTDMITKIRPDYKPWVHSLWTPPSDEVESLLFSLQAGLGAGVIGYYFGLRRGQARKGTQAAAHASD